MSMSALKSAERYTVLLLEDNPGDTDLVIERLVGSPERSFNILATTTLAQALTTLAANPVDAMIIDLNLPDSSGIETLRSLKQQSREVPILVMTGDASEHLRSAAFAEGVQDYIGKDDPPSSLLARSLIYSMERYRAQEYQRQILHLVSASPDAILVVDMQGIVRYVNEAATVFFGRPAPDFVGETAGFPLGDTEVSEISIVSRDGRRIAEMRVVRMLWLGEPALIAYLRDVTEKRRLGEQLQQAQKMDAIGRLAGGVAHDFNNLLSVINGYADLLIENRGSEEESSELLLEIRKAGQRAAGLTRQLLAFGRKSIFTPRPLNLNDVVADLERMLRRLIGEDVLLATVLDPDLGLVLADSGRIEQVLLNLCLNGRDAMPNGGHLTLETRNFLVEPEMAGVDSELLPGNYVLLSVSDTGVGMDEETRRHIFEPFFTTKGIGEGTGLGLATSYGIIRQSGGRIQVYTEPGFGTTFRIYLPRTNHIEEKESPELRLSRIASGTESILLVEDEPGVRRFCRMVLQSKGYTVLEAQSAQQALELARAHTGPIELLLTDVVMPRLSGRELKEILTQLCPGIRVLYMSGYTDDAVVRHGILSTDVAFLQKPFSAAALAAAIRRTLDSTPDTGPPPEPDTP